MDWETLWWCGPEPDIPIQHGCSKLSAHSGGRLETWTVIPSVEGCDLEKRLGCSPCLSWVEEGEVFQLGFFLETTPLPAPGHLGAGSLVGVSYHIPMDPILS